MRKILSIISAAAILLTAGCGAAVPDTNKLPEATATPAPVEISCFIDSDISNVLNDIYKKYSEKHPELSVVFRAEPAEEIQRLVEGGSSCDIVFSSSQESIASLDDSGLIVSESVTPLIESSAVLIRSAKSKTLVTGFSDLNKAANIAVLKKDTPLGSYSYELLNDYGITITTDEYDSVKDIITAVADGDNETGIIYSTDASLAKDEIKTISDPEDDTAYTTAEYTAALVNNSSADPARQKAAEAFFKYLLTNASRNSFIYYGFTMK
ncbi:MAG: molybdate ABC transporter substrate-binding protein [Oscillospiraceae bacterium]|nr:molybdate ABC transporter substrate-binding protein [Oscillospiraceae bacterium]